MADKPGFKTIAVPNGLGGSSFLEKPVSSPAGGTREAPVICPRCGTAMDDRDLSFECPRCGRQQVQPTSCKPERAPSAQAHNGIGQRHHREPVSGCACPHGISVHRLCEPCLAERVIAEGASPPGESREDAPSAPTVRDLFSKLRDAERYFDVHPESYEAMADFEMRSAEFWKAIDAGQEARERLAAIAELATSIAADFTKVQRASDAFLTIATRAAR